MSKKISITAPDALAPFNNEHPSIVKLGPKQDVHWQWGCDEKGKWTVIGHKIVPRHIDRERKCAICYDTGARKVMHPFYGKIDEVWCEYCDHGAPKSKTISKRKGGFIRVSK